MNVFGCARVATSLGNNTWCQTPSCSHTIITLLFSSRLSLSQNIWSGLCSWFSGSFAGRICILVLQCPFNRSSFDGCTNFLVAFPLPLPLSLLLQAVFDKKVESNVIATSDETLRLGMGRSRAKSLATKMPLSKGFWPTQVLLSDPSVNGLDK